MKKPRPTMGATFATQASDCDCDPAYDECTTSCLYKHHLDWLPRAVCPAAPPTDDDGPERRCDVCVPFQVSPDHVS